MSGELWPYTGIGRSSGVTPGESFAASGDAACAACAGARADWASSASSATTVDRSGGFGSSALAEGAGPAIGDGVASKK